jgi:hypothetical protein
LSPASPAETVGTVKYLLLLSVIFLAGCETTKPTGEIEYTRLMVTDVNGDFISEWIAEGKTTKGEWGYEINAVERRTAPPHPTTNRYPNGRKATVVGPNIILETVEKPSWLRRLDE